jgi:acyl carrier protein
MALGQALDGPDSALTVMDVDWSQFAITSTPFLKDLPEAARLAQGAATAVPETGHFAARLAGLPRVRQIQLLTDVIRSSAAAVLGHDASVIQDSRAFADLGFDSLTSLEVRQQLSAVTGLTLPATMLFDYPTPSALAVYLQEQACGPDAAPEPVLGELDKLEALLAEVDPGDQRRAWIADRLHAIARQFGAEPVDAASAETGLAAATNDEMFQLIEDELRDSDFD